MHSDHQQEAEVFEPHAQARDSRRAPAKAADKRPVVPHLVRKGRVRRFSRRSPVALYLSIALFAVGAGMASFVALAAGVIDTAPGDVSVDAPPSQSVTSAADDYAQIVTRTGARLSYNHQLDNAVVQFAINEAGDLAEESEPNGQLPNWVERDYREISISPSTNQSLVPASDPGSVSLREATPELKFSVLSELTVDTEASQTVDEALRLYIENEFSSTLSDNQSLTVGDQVTTTAGTSLIPVTVTTTTTYDNLLDSGTRDYAQQTQNRFFVSDNTVHRIELVGDERRSTSSEVYSRYQAIIENLELRGPSVTVDQSGDVAVLGDQDNATGELGSVVSRYDPAVVQIAHYYCAEVEVAGYTSQRSYCASAQGTGFIISNDGYVLTNGHVVDIGFNELAVAAVSAGDTEVLAGILSVIEPGFSRADYIAAAGILTSVPESLELELLYSNLNGQLQAKNEQLFYSVQIGTQLVQYDENLLKPSHTGVVSNPFEYGTNNVGATLVASDYNPRDPLEHSIETGLEEYRYKNSDVALLKLDANRNSHPVTTLGDGSVLTTGSQLTIIGYPGAAEVEGLVTSDEVESTTTQGIISKLTEAAGSDNKLIQTDATIDQGNSGGPAFAADGTVVGLATYGVRSGGVGGTFNFARDIDDGKALLVSNNVDTTADSVVQKLWEDGLAQFDQNRFSRAIELFEEVQTLYPAHKLADEFISISNQKIAAGEEVTDFPVVLAAAAGGSLLLALAAIGTFVVLNRRHRNKLDSEGLQPGQAVAAEGGQYFAQPPMPGPAINQAPQVSAVERVIQPPVRTAGGQGAATGQTTSGQPTTTSTQPSYTPPAPLPPMPSPATSAARPQTQAPTPPPVPQPSVRQPQATPSPAQPSPAVQPQPLPPMSAAQPTQQPTPQPATAPQQQSQQSTPKPAMQIPIVHHQTDQPVASPNGTHVPTPPPAL